MEVHMRAQAGTKAVNEGDRGQVQGGRRQPGSPVQRHSSWPVGRDECRCLVDQG